MVRTNEYPVARVDPVKKLGLLPRMAYTSSGHEPSFSPQGRKQRKETQGPNLAIKTLATLGVLCVLAVNHTCEGLKVSFPRGDAEVDFRALLRALSASAGKQNVTSQAKKV